MGQVVTLTNEEKNRICIWLSVLHKVNDYCAVCEEQQSKLTKVIENQDWGTYYVGGRSCSYLYPHVIEKGLLEAAIVGLGSIFNSGDGGVGIAKNKSNGLEWIKDELIRRTALKLGYANPTCLYDYIQKFREYRDQIIAHYDGSKAEYEEDFFDVHDSDGNIVGKEPGIIKMRMPSISFSHEKIIELKEIALKIHESLLDLLNAIDNQEPI